MLLSFPAMDNSLRSEHTRTCSFQCSFCLTLDINLRRVRPAKGSVRCAKVLKQTFTVVTQQAQMFI